MNYQYAIQQQVEGRSNRPIIRAPDSLRGKMLVEGGFQPSATKYSALKELIASPGLEASAKKLNLDYLSYCLDSEGAGLPSRNHVYSFDKQFYDFYYAESSSMRNQLPAASSSKDCRFVKQVPSNQPPKRVVAKVQHLPSTANRRLQIKPAITGQSPQGSNLISLFDSDAPHEEPSGRQKCVVTRQAPLKIKMEVTNNSEEQYLEFLQLKQEEYRAEQGCIGTQQSGYLLGKRTATQCEAGKSGRPCPDQCCKQLMAQKQHQHPGKVSSLFAERPFSGNQHLVQGSPEGRLTWLEDNYGEGEMGNLGLKPSKPAISRGAGIIIETMDPNDFYSDSEQQTRVPFTLGAEDVQQVPGNLITKPGRPRKLKPEAAIAVQSQPKIQETKQANLAMTGWVLPAVSCQDATASQRLAAGNWVVTPKIGAPDCKFKIAEDAELFDVAKLQRYLGIQLKLSNPKANQRAYLCKYCASVFKTGCALGGHISKIHRGVNFDYCLKMQHRREFKIERDRSKFLKDVIIQPS